ncbi:alkaline phosphatase [Kistimonas scapharcae]
MYFRKKLLAGLVVAGCAAMAGCALDGQQNTETVAESGKVKNVIMMIGDGMGPQQVGLLRTYAHRAPNSIYEGRPTGIDRLIEAGVLGVSSTGPHDKIVVDSACSATQLATGEPALSEVIGVGTEGEYLETILERAQKMGKATGLVSDTRLTHATPAAFAAHQPHRNLENEIAVDMIRIGPDVMFSGGLRHFVPKSVNDKGATYEAIRELNDGAFTFSSKRKDEVNLLTEAQTAGYQLAFTREQMDKVQDGKVLGLFANSGMMDGIDYAATKDAGDRSEPTLKEMTMKALDILSQDEDGFFLMVEGGQIDWAGHENDVGAMLHDMVKFDEAIEAVYEWVAQRNDTLMIVTADHETGSFGFSYSMKDVPEPQKLPAPGFGDEHDYQPMFNFADLSLLDRIYAQTRSNKNIWGDFESLPADQQTAKKLAELMSKHHAFEVTEAMAATVLKTSPNRFQKAGHSYLASKTWPAVDTPFESFYVYGEETRWNLMGHALAEDQYVVWGTGTHTDTPVLVMTFGPEAATAPFSKFLTHPEVGQLAKDALK